MISHSHSVGLAMAAIAVTVAAFVICGSSLLAASTFLPSTHVEAGNRSASADPKLDAPASDTHLSEATIKQPPREQKTSQLLADSNQREIQTATIQPAADTQNRRSDQPPHANNGSVDLGAIRADGRYTQLLTRQGVKFCPWSITEA